MKLYYIIHVYEGETIRYRSCLPIWFPINEVYDFVHEARQTSHANVHFDIVGKLNDGSEIMGIGIRFGLILPTLEQFMALVNNLKQCSVF